MSRRSVTLPERYRALVFNTKTPHSIQTFLVNGQVAGCWSHEEGGRIALEPFERLPKETCRALDDEAEHMAELFT
ncbi:MAG: winged helix DNA-binding domain-containing protein [Actinomycetota bacterium]|nr:winged helix DNA-binding domain-containing protein [Actinomycetota bacterium]